MVISSSYREVGENSEKQRHRETETGIAKRYLKNSEGGKEFRK